MLSDRELELLTGYLDGELSARHRRRAERLLRASEEARALLSDLQTDSRHLLELPPVPAPVDLHRSVMAGISMTKRKPTSARQRPVRTFPSWTGWAAAAAVLLVIGVGTFVSYSKSGPNHGVVVKKPKGGEQGLKGEGELVKNLPRPEKNPDDPPQHTPVDDPKRNEEPKDQPPLVKPLDGQREPPPVVFGDGGREGTIKVERVQIALPVVYGLYGLEKDARKLREQFATGSSFRVELLARNATSLPKDAPRAFDRISTALAARKFTTVIDSTAQGNLKRPQFRHDYALFVENITPAELADLLAAIGEADSAAAKKKGSDQRFDGSLVVKEMSAWDRKELADLIGLDPVGIRPVQPKTGNVDIRKPISEGTSKLIDDVLEGKRPARSESEGKSVLVLPLGSSRRNSAEVKRYLDGRKPATAGTVQALIVLRTLP